MDSFNSLPFFEACKVSSELIETDIYKYPSLLDSLLKRLQKEFDYPPGMLSLDHEGRGLLYFGAELISKLIALGKYKEACEVYEKISPLDTRDGAGLRELGVSAALLNDNEKLVRKILKNYPEDILIGLMVADFLTGGNTTVSELHNRNIYLFGLLLGVPQRDGKLDVQEFITVGSEEEAVLFIRDCSGKKVWDKYERIWKPLLEEIKKVSGLYYSDDQRESLLAELNTEIDDLIDLYKKLEYRKVILQTVEKLVNLKAWELTGEEPILIASSQELTWSVLTGKIGLDYSITFFDHYRSYSDFTSFGEEPDLFISTQIFAEHAGYKIDFNDEIEITRKDFGFTPREPTTAEMQLMAGYSIGMLEGVKRTINRDESSVRLSSLGLYIPKIAKEEKVQYKPSFTASIDSSARYGVVWPWIRAVNKEDGSFMRILGVFDLKSKLPVGVLPTHGEDGCFKVLEQLFDSSIPRRVEVLDADFGSYLRKILKPIGVTVCTKRTALLEEFEDYIFDSFEFFNDSPSDSST